MGTASFPSLLLVLILACGLLAGCRTEGRLAPNETPAATTAAPTTAPTTAAPMTEAPTEAPTTAAPTEAPTEAPTTEAPTEPLIDESELPLADYALTWAAAFRSNRAPDGELPGDQIAFCNRQSDGTLTIENVSKADLLENQPDRLPRTHYFEQFLPQCMLELLPVLDYAYAHGCSRIAVPTVNWDFKDMEPNQRYLNATYRNNNSIMSIKKVDTLEMDSGVNLRYFLITIGAFERGEEIITHYREAIAAAETLVDSIPEGLDEEQTMLYLYRWLTDNVEYDHDDYYSSDGVNLLYDAMIKHKTVCAGYTEALYYLSNLAGIECFTASGSIWSDGELESHIWNVAKINGAYYQFDSTWDAGLQPAEYSYFGVSVETMMNYHKREYVAFSQKHLPEMTEDLLPVQDWTILEDDDLGNAMWYLLLRNARNGNPALMFDYFGVSNEMEEAGDGWLRCTEDPDEFRELLAYVMTPDEVDRFCDGYLRVRDGTLQVRAPDPDAPSYRLVSAELLTDGSCVASLMVYKDYAFTPKTVIIRLQDAHVAAVEELD